MIHLRSMRLLILLWKPVFFYQQKRNSGFSLVEILVVVSILSIFAGIAIDTGLQSLKRERINSVVVPLAGWLETVRASAASGNNCVVTISTGTLTSGSTLAALDSSLSSSSCHNITLKMPEDSSNSSFAIATSTPTLSYTKRGTLSTISDLGVLITVTPADGSSPRCISITGLPGFLALGRYIGGNCLIDSRF